MTDETPHKLPQIASEPSDLLKEFVRELAARAYSPARWDLRHGRVSVVRVVPSAPVGAIPVLPLDALAENRMHFGHQRTVERLRLENSGFQIPARRVAQRTVGKTREGSPPKAR